MPPPMKRHAFVRRLGFAVDGIRAAWRRERNFRIQLVFAGALVVLLLALRPGFYWAAIFLLVAALVLSAEMINSALEALIDHLHPDIHPEIRIIKDMAAGAVLVFSLTALLIAALFIWQTWLV
jgi:diacylglycerol kinase